MKRILKNPSNSMIKTNFEGRVYIIKPKGSLGVDDEGRDGKVADYLLQTYEFLQEIKSKITYPIQEPVKARGRAA